MHRIAPWLALGAVVAVLSAFAVGFMRGDSAARQEIEAEAAIQRAKDMQEGQQDYGEIKGRDRDQLGDDIERVLRGGAN